MRFRPIFVLFTLACSVVHVLACGSGDANFGFFDGGGNGGNGGSAQATSVGSAGSAGMGGSAGAVSSSGSGGAAQGGSAGAAQGGSGGTAQGGSGGTAQGGSGGTAQGGSGGTAQGGSGGAGGASVDAGTDCPGATGVTTLASWAMDQPHGLVVDSTHAYVLLGEPEHLWENSALMRVPLGGGTSQILFSARASGSRGGVVEGLALDASSVYWTSAAINGSPGGVSKISKTGGQPVFLAANQDSARGISTDGTFVYWGTLSDIMRVSVNGGTPTSLIASGANHVAVDDTQVYWVWGPLMAAPIQGGARRTLANVNYDIGAIAVDAEAVYFSGVSRGTILKVQKSGGAPMVLAPESDSNTYNLTLDATHVYWTTRTEGMRRVPKAGGAVAPFGADPSARHIAVDRCHVYWTSIDAGAFKYKLMMAKK